MPKAVMNPRVFWGASLIVVLLLAVAAVAPDASAYVFEAAQSWVIGAFGWFYVAAVAGFLLTALALAFGPTGRLKLGPDDSEPDFPYPSWLAMLFAAGMGIGLMYFAVAEPVEHYAAPPEAAPHTIEAAREAMVITFVHWGVHAWAVYAIVGLSLAFFAHRKGLPLTLRSGLYPLLGRRINGPLGDAVDIFAIWGTLFGIATSLGLGVAQINSGLNYLVGLPSNPVVQIGLIGLVMGAATVSVLTGLDRGVRRLSEINLVLALCLMVFVLALGPTAFLAKALIQNFGLYLDQFFLRTFNLYAYEPRGWMANWTLFYWAWWIAWSPFVGMFIARISRGRTVREFIIGVLLVPSGFTFLWMTVFGNTAISLDMGAAAGAISQAVSSDLSTAIFHFLDYLPGTTITSTLAVMLVAVFFVTSADSGSLVIDTIASGGADETPRWQRVYWCALEGAAAAVLLLVGGLGALQAATLVAALPFALIMILLAVGLVRQMNDDLAGAPLHQHTPLRQSLKRMFAPPRRADIERQIEQEAGPALRALCEALETEGVVSPRVSATPAEVRLEIPAQGAEGFLYRLDVEAQPLPAYSFLDAPEGRRSREWRLMARVGARGRRRDVTGFSRDQLIADVLDQLDHWRRGGAHPAT